MDPALWELWQQGNREDEVAAIVRLSTADAVPDDMRVIARFGEIVTCRMRRGAILTVRGAAEVTSLKAARPMLPDFDLSEESAVRETDQRRSIHLDATGRDVVIGVVDWGFDFAHPDFCNAGGSSRILALWDQRSRPAQPAPQPYGYGVVHTQSAIEQALTAPNPYTALGYHPADADPGGGCHATHVASIAAGNGRGGGVLGVAPDTKLVFVHMSSLDAPDQDSIGNSVTLLEAIDFILRTAGNRPCVINLSMGRHGEQHDGTTLVEQGFDALLQARSGLAIVQSTGNYYGRRIHTAGQLRPTESRTIVWQIRTGDRTANQLEVWYSGRDRFAVELCSPEGVCQRVMLGDRSLLKRQGQASDFVARSAIGTIYHRAREPNNHDNHINIFLYAGCPTGTWKLTLTGEDVIDGRYNAWIERDDGAPNSQSVFDSDDALETCTTGTICNGFRTIAVGAYNSHSAEAEIASFSSSGPTRDGRIKPDLVAPGVAILAARSAPYGDRPALLLTRKSGTSMAAPHVTGTVALMFEAAPRPLHIDETRNLLLAATQPASELDKHRIGSGYLDIDRAVAAARNLTSPDLSRQSNLKEAAMYHSPTAPTQHNRSTLEDFSETVLNLGQLSVNSNPIAVNAPSATPNQTVASLDAAIEWVLAQPNGQFAVSGSLLNPTQFQIFRIDPVLSIPAAPVLTFTPTADVCALLFQAGKGYFPADPVAIGSRWVEIPRLREFYTLAAIDRREQRRLWISRILVAQQRITIPNVTLSQTWLQRLSMPALRLLLAHFAADIFSVRSVDQPDRRFRGGDVAGVTLPLVRYPLVEPDCYLPVISGREGKLEAINAYDLGAGVSLGAIQFNVQRGALFRWLWTLWQQDRDLFNQELGTPLGWSMQQNGSVTLRVNAGTPQAVTLNSDDRTIGYLQSGTPGRTEFNDIDANFRRSIAARFRNVVAYPHVQEMIVDTTAWWLTRGLTLINNAGIPALNSQTPDRDTFILKALLLSAYVRYSGCLAPLLAQLQPWITTSEKLQNLIRVLDQTGDWGNCNAARKQHLKERLRSQESEAVRVHNLILRLIPAAPARETAIESMSFESMFFDVAEVNDAAMDMVEFAEFSEGHVCGCEAIDSETNTPEDVEAIDDAASDAPESEPFELYECGSGEDQPEALVEWAEAAIAAGLPRASGAIVSHVFSQAGVAESLSPSSESGIPSPALMFDAFAPGGSPALQRHFAQFFEVVATPGMALSQSPRSGDLLVRRALGEGNCGHVAMIAAPELHSFEQAIEQLVPETAHPGWYAHIVEGGAIPHSRHDRFARRVLDASGRLPSDQMLLRPIVPAIAGRESEFAEGLPPFLMSDNQKRMTKIRKEAGNDDAEALARFFEDAAIQDNGTIAQRLDSILKATKYFDSIPLHTALDFHDRGFKTDFKDPYPSSDNQVGHFLTAVSFSYNPAQISWLRGGIGADANLANSEVAMRLAIGHELYPDPGWWNLAAFLPINLAAKLFLSPNLLPDDVVDVFAKQYQTVTAADVTAFQEALNALGNSALSLTANLSAAIPYLRPIESRIQPNSKGNSVQDLRLTLLGWHLAQEITKGRLKDCAEIARWIRLNLHA